MKFVFVKSFDGTIVRIKKDELSKFEKNQEKIKNWEKEGLSLKKINDRLKKEGK